jgi:hypothetical protein
MPVEGRDENGPPFNDDDVCLPHIGEIYCLIDDRLAAFEVVVYCDKNPLIHAVSPL